jgi:hypothetical protein
MLSKLATLALAGAASMTAFGASAQTQEQAQPGVNQPGAAQPGMNGMNQSGMNQPGATQQGLSQTCAFNAGPRAGQTVDFGGSPGAVAVQMGSRCADMQGSSGQAVAGGRQQGQGRFYTSPGAPNAWSSAGLLKQGYTQSCNFTSGPRAGTTFNYSHTLGAQPVTIGSACSDAGSKGFAVASGR